MDSQKTEQRYRQFFEHANDAIFVVNLLNGKIIDANKQALRVFGYSYEEITQLTVEQLEAPLDSTNNPNFITNQNLIYEQAYKRKDGTIFLGETSSRLIKDEAAPIILNFTRDISWRKSMEENERKQRQFAEAMSDIATALNGTVALDEVLDLILEHLSRVVEYDSTSIFMIEGDVAKMVRFHGIEEYKYPHQLILKTTKTLQWMIEHQQPIVIQDTLESDLWVQTATNTDWIRSYVGAPIILDKQVIGFLNLDNLQPNQFTSKDADKLYNFAIHAALAIHKAQLFEQIQQQTKELEERVQERTAELTHANKILQEEIYERQQVEAKLAEERNLLQTLIDHLPDSICAKNLNSEFIMANDQFIENNPVDSLEDLLGKTSQELYGTPDANLYMQEDQQVFTTGQTNIRERVFYDDAGERHHWIITKVPTFDHEGNITGLIGVNHDISKISRAEEKLQRIVHSARCLLWLATVEDINQIREWTIYTSNMEAAQRFLPLDVPNDSDYMQEYSNAIVNEQRESMNQLAESALLSGLNEYSQEYLGYDKYNQLHWIKEDVHIIQLEPHRWSLVGVCTDITQRKIAEIKLQQANELLEKRVQERTQEILNINQNLRQEIEERKRAEEAEREQRLFAEALTDGIGAINGTLDLEEVLNKIVEVSARTISTENTVNLMLADPDFQYFQSVASYGFDNKSKQLLQQVRLQTNLPIVQKALQEKQTWLINDTHNSSEWVSFNPTQWIRSNMGIPIYVNQDCIGLITISSAEPNSFTVIHAQRLKAFANQVGIAIQNARLIEQIHQYTTLLEKRVLDRTQELEIERSRLATILESMQDGVVYLDHDGNALYVNQSLINLMGYSFNEWLNGTAYLGSEKLSQPEYDKTIEQINNTILSDDLWREEQKAYRKDGSALDIEITASRVKSDQHNGIIAVIRDISQAKLLEKQRKNFITVASHELRTPISNLKTRLYLIRRQPEKLEKHLAILEEATEWLQDLVETMFDLSQFEHGYLILNKEHVSLPEIIQTSLNFHQSNAEQKSIKLNFQPTIQPIVNVDRKRLIQAVDNMIINALRHISQPGEITVRLDSDEVHTMIYVEDTGEGIQEDLLPHIFEPFVRSHDSSKGAGLGLSIVKEIIEAHAGNISVESKVGKGTTFIIRLPQNIE